MLRNIIIITLAATVIALPFIFRRSDDVASWHEGNPRLIIISPHNEAIRYEFGHAFSDWYNRKYGVPVKVDWRIIGGTSEIMRYLEGECMASFQAYWKGLGREWPLGGGELALDRRFDPNAKSSDPELSKRWAEQHGLYQAFRAHDDPKLFGTGIDLIFGGGTYDHGKLSGQGMSVRPWGGAEPPTGILRSKEGDILIPREVSGERWRSPYYFGNAVSTFGICYNVDRLADLGIERPPQSWNDLADPRYIHQIGVADPTKSGSIAKAFEMIIHQQCSLSVERSGFDKSAVDQFEKAIAESKSAGQGWPGSVPDEYQVAIADGWLAGIKLVRRIAANARYFTDSAGKVPVDVGSGDLAAGLAIDFYGRYQSEFCRGPDGRERLIYVTPQGGSSVSADPVSLLRGAPHRELAVRFIEFVLSEEGQRLWNSEPGTPGGPRKYSLRRLPVRRDFYPSDNPAFERHYRAIEQYAVDDLSDQSVNPFELAEHFTYRPRWTARLFGLHRDLIRSMCLDSGQELRTAWAAIVAAGGPEQCPKAMEVLERMPDVPAPLTWDSAYDVIRDFGRLETMREWTIFFRDQYREARRIAEGRGM